MSDGFFFLKISSQGVILSKSQLQGQNKRGSSSPTLIMEVEAEDEERQEEEEKERVVKMAAVSTFCRGKHKQNEKCAGCGD